MVQQHDGRIPQNEEELSSLPGFGRYTVNAVLSQAFGKRYPLLMQCCPCDLSFICLEEDFTMQGNTKLALVNS